MNDKNIFIFDVEAVDLHGEGFAVGAIVFGMHGQIIDKFELLSTEIANKSSEWVSKNILPHLNNMPKCETGLQLRNEFFEFYLKHKDTCLIWSDCNFPVETNFLSVVVNDDIENRQWLMPYPLYDVSNFVNINIDRSEEYKKERNDDSIRKHHPVDDCLCSYYCLTKNNFFKN